MESIVLSALIKQRGAELPDFYLSEVEVVDGRVSRVVETFIIDMVVLAFGRHVGTKVHIATIQLVSEIASAITFDQGAEEAEVEAVDLDLPAATTMYLLSDGTIWFTDKEEGQDTHWCIHSPDHPLLPGHKAAKLA